ncbi:MAG: hypothetical protein GX046_08220 [Tissierellia bacterium]|nr:hypothetical protein [Tissierellia bacterium]
MRNIMNQANFVTNELLENYDENELYIELALRLKLMEEDPSRGIPIEPGLRFFAEEAMMDKENFDRIGREIFKRWSGTLYKFTCGSDPDDKSYHEKIFSGDLSLGGAIVIFLTTQFGVLPAIATVLAALVVKLFLDPVHQVLCEEWKAKLPDLRNSTL